MQVFENRALRRTREPKRKEVTENRENCIIRSFIISSPNVAKMTKSQRI